MSMFQNATCIAIQDGTFVVAEAGGTVTIHQGGGPGASSAFKDLSSAAAHAALPDSAERFNAPRCHKNTRTKYLNKFEKWLLGELEEWDGKRLIWLNGGAGAGKSAIMQSIIERCACHTVVLGGFFFSRADSTRNHAEVLIPTLAYQVARAFPASMAVLAPVILGDPLIFKASPSTQAYQLLVRPILHLIETGIIDITGTIRKVFIIDGLDECSDPKKQAFIIRTIASILCEHDIPISFLVASRPEVAITNAFQREKQLLRIFASISLDDDEDARSDIRQFIEDSFLDILESHPLRMHIEMPWPSSDSVDRLVQKSSGHFIYSATAMQFIASSDEHPARALKVVEGIVPSRTGIPFAELDALYAHVLTHARYSKEVLGILKHYYLTELPRSVAAVSYIHNIPPEDVILFLSDVQSLISLIPDDMAELTITTKHASLNEFLKSPRRSGALYIGMVEEYDASLLACYFHLVDNGLRLPISFGFYPIEVTMHFIQRLGSAIENSQETDLCLSLIHRHSCYDIWNLCVESCAGDAESLSCLTRNIVAYCIQIYMSAVREFSIKIHDKTVFFHQFKLHIQLILDDLNDFVHRKPQYHIIPAIMFSSTPSSLYWASRLLSKWYLRFRIAKSYQDLFYYYARHIDNRETDLSVEAIRSLPESRVSWGSDLAIVMKLVLDQLVHFSRPSDMPYTTPHKRWLRQHKPLKQIALGSPRLPSTFFANLIIWAHPDECTGDGAYSFWILSVNRFWKGWHSQKISSRKLKCLTLLKAVIFYARKSDCTIEVVKLARRSLPIAAQWYPRLMKRARAELDAYVHRWEDSVNSSSRTKGFVDIRR